MEINKYSHCGGINVAPLREVHELIDALKSTSIPLSHGYGSELRNELLETLGRKGWSKQVKVDQQSNITITSQKDSIGLCVQTSGNMSRMYADLLKLQKMYLDRSITVGIFILPTSKAAKLMGDNLANSDRLENELRIFNKVISMPLVVISFE